MLDDFIIHLFHYDFVTERWEYQWRNGLLAGVVVSGGIVADHLSILNVDTPTNTIDLRTQAWTHEIMVNLPTYT